MNCSLSFFFFGQNSLCTAQWRWVIFSWEKNKVNNKLRLVASSKNIYYSTESNGARRWRFKPRANQNINLLKSRTFKPRVFTNFTWYLREVFSALLYEQRHDITETVIFIYQYFYRYISRTTIRSYFLLKFKRWLNNSNIVLARSQIDTSQRSYAVKTLQLYTCNALSFIMLVRIIVYTE